MAATKYYFFGQSSVLIESRIDYEYLAKDVRRYSKSTYSCKVLRYSCN